MKNILYITTQDIGISHGIGIKNKIFSQLESFHKNGFTSNLIAFDKGDIVSIKNIKTRRVINRSSEIKNKRLSIYKVINNFINTEKIEYIYIRYFFSDPIFIKTLKKIKSQQIKILIEIPTYPYTGELPKNIKGDFIKRLDYLYSKKLKKYVDYIITFSDDKEIFEIECINIENGVKVENLPKKSVSIRNNELRLIGVANISFWHGFDRVINGIKEYYKENRESEKIDIYFNIIGDGIEKEKLEKLVVDNKLSKYIKFKGMMRGKSLDLIFNESDIAIGSLGIHRLGLNSVSTLKSKEYFARGIPFIYSYKENFINDNLERYAYKVESNDNPIDMNFLISKHKQNKDGDKIIREMRQFAENYLTWDYQVQKIIFKIEDKSN